MGWLGREQYRTSPRAKPAALTIWHTPDYVAGAGDGRAQAMGQR
jgi:acetoin utilization protein AcuC